MPMVSKACDACRLRRTKCDGGQPCRRCFTSDISCTFELQRRQRGPKGKTVQLLQQVLGSGSVPKGSNTEQVELEQAGHAVGSDNPIGAQNPLADGPQTTSDSGAVQPGPFDLSAWFLGNVGFDGFQQPTYSTPAGSPTPLALTPHPGSPIPSPSGQRVAQATFTCLFNPTIERPLHAFHSRASMLDLMDGLLESGVTDYFRYIHDLWPVVDSKAIQARFAHKEHLVNESFAAMILAMVAFRLLLQYNGEGRPAGSGTNTGQPTNASRAETLLREAIAMHNVPDLAMKPTLDTISATMIIAGVLRVTRGFNASHLRSREAITLAELLNLSDPATYEHFSADEKATALNIYWLLAAVERSNALLRPRLESPTFRPRLSIRGQLTHLRNTVPPGARKSLRLEPCTRLFEIMDESLIECIHATCSPTACSLSVAKVMEAHRAIDSVVSPSDLSPVQVADIAITSLWLHAEIWRACVTHSFLSASVQTPDTPELRIQYPVEVLGKVAYLLKTLPFASIHGNGRGMGHKLLAVVAAANTVLDLPEPPEEFDGVRSIEEGKVLARQVSAVGQSLVKEQYIRWEAPN